MLLFKNTAFTSFIFVLLLSLVSCGGGTSSKDLPPEEVKTKPAVIKGFAHLGPIENGDITVYSFVDGNRGITPLA